MKNIGLIFVAVWLFFTVGGTAIGGSPITYSEPTTFSGCEFRVFFPTKTKQKSVFANGIESSIVQSVYDGESPFMRAECLPLSNPNETIAAFRSMQRDAHDFMRFLFFLFFCGDRKHKSFDTNSSLFVIRNRFLVRHFQRIIETESNS